MKVIVVGGGASGLVAAIMTAKNHNKVTLLEKNKICGKKILITGNGKCNYWNESQDLCHYYSSNMDVIKDIINCQNQNAVLALFNSIGIIPRIKDGYYYPYSNQASSIQTALVKEALLSGVTILYEEIVEDITYQNTFIVTTNHTTHMADKVILATGSKACPKTGSDGIGYLFAQKLGHSLIEPAPALVQLKSDEKYVKEWAGIRTEVEVSLYQDNQLVKTETGEIQLTDYGISGICVFQLSRYVAKSISSSKKQYVSINFLPYIKSEEMMAFMSRRNKTVKNRTIAELLDGLLNYKLVNLLLKISKIDRNEIWEQIKREKKDILISNLVSLQVNIIGTNSFDQAQTCTGGIPLIEIDPYTMESLKQKGLYITGELLDVDGDCGGYNLSFAWITGYVAGTSIKEEL